MRHGKWLLLILLTIIAVWLTQMFPEKPIVASKTISQPQSARVMKPGKIAKRKPSATNAKGETKITVPVGSTPNSPINIGEIILRPVK